MTAQDIARGMTYLHDDNVIHGDLKGSNVLLQRRATDPRGYVAKVRDFSVSHIFRYTLVVCLAVVYSLSNKCKWA